MSLLATRGGSEMSKRRALDDISRLPKTIERGAVHMGNIEGMDNYLVHGQVFGDSDVQGTLMLSENCVWKGKVVADVVVIKGKVEGDVVARSKIELRNTAVVVGNLQAPIVAIEHGATLRGNIQKESLITHFQERRTH